jgi:hypothetical protein
MMRSDDLSRVAQRALVGCLSVIAIVAICGCLHFLTPITHAAEAATMPTTAPWLREAEAAWRQITEATGDGPRPEGDMVDVKFDTWWLDMAESAGAAFWALCREPDLEKKLKYYVEQFGRHGPEADYMWMLANPGILTREMVAMPEHWRGNHAEMERVVNRLRETIGRAQVELFLAKPEVMERFYYAAVASLQLFKRGSDQGIALNWLAEWTVGEMERGENYWLNARNFILLAHATGRDDLYRGKRPEDLAEPCAAWARWATDNEAGLHMVVDKRRLVWRFDPAVEYDAEDFPSLPLPRTPLPDWKGPLPPRVGVLGVLAQWEHVVQQAMHEALKALGAGEEEAPGPQER